MDDRDRKPRRRRGPREDASLLTAVVERRRIRRLQGLATLGMLALSVAVVAAGASAAGTPAAPVASSLPAGPNHRVVVSAHPAVLFEELERPGSANPQAFQAWLAGVPARISPDRVELQVPGGRRFPARPAGTASRPAVTTSRLIFLGANRNARAAALESSSAHVSRFLGADPSRWQIGSPLYSRIGFDKIYPGIDVRYRGNDGAMEIVFLLAPHADSSRIRLRCDGAPGARVDADGALLLPATAGHLRVRAPIAYQEEAGRRKPVEARWRVSGKGIAGLALGGYDAARSLVIDPEITAILSAPNDTTGSPVALAETPDGGIVLADTLARSPVGGGWVNDELVVAKLSGDLSHIEWLAYLGGTLPDDATGMAVDHRGNIVVVGWTWSADFPLASPLQSRLLGGCDGFIVKLDPTGQHLLFGSYLGGGAAEWITAVAVGRDDTLFVGGITRSPDFPVTTGAFDTRCGTDAMCNPYGYDLTPLGDGFVTKIDTETRRIEFSTFLGGTARDEVTALAVDSLGRPVVAGTTLSPDFPTTPGALDRTCGGEGVCGRQPTEGLFDGWDDGFVARLSADGRFLDYSTYLGGWGADVITALVLDDLGRPIVAGNTISPDLPTTEGAFDRTCGANGLCGRSATHPGPSYDGFIIGLDEHGANVVFGTYFGGTEATEVTSLARLPDGDLAIAGDYQGQDLPAKTAWQGQRWVITSQSGSNEFVARFDPTASGLRWASYLGGQANASFIRVAALANGDVAIAQSQSEMWFPTIEPRPPGLWGTFVVRVADTSRLADLRVDQCPSGVPMRTATDWCPLVDVTNLGPDTARSVGLFQWTWPGPTMYSATPSQGLCTIEMYMVVCQLGDIEPGGRAFVVLEPPWPLSPALTSMASVRSLVADPDSRNNLSSVTIGPAPRSAIHFVAGDSPAEVGVDEPFTASVIVSNLGDSPSQPVLLRVATWRGPATLERVTVPGGTCGGSEQGAACTLAPLAGHASAVVTARLRSLAEGTIDVDFILVSPQSTEEFNPIARAEIIARQPFDTPFQYLVPGTTRRTDEAGRVWRTDAMVVNSLPKSTRIALRYRSNGLVRSAELELGPLAAVQWDDVVGELFGTEADGAAGVLEIGSEVPLAIDARSYFETGHGTLGQGLPVVPVKYGSVWSTGGSCLLPLRSTASLRTDLGLLNTSYVPLTARVELFSPEYVGIGAVPPVEVPALGWVEVKDLLAQAKVPGLELAQGQVSGTSSITLEDGGGIVPFASLVDRSSGDPTAIEYQSYPYWPTWVPGVAHLVVAGAPRTLTDLVLANAAYLQPSTVTLTLRAAGREISRQVTVQGQSLIQIANVLETTFGVSPSESVVGLIKVVDANGYDSSTVRVLSRTYSPTADGEPGYVMGAPSAQVPVPGPGELGILSHLRSDKSFRTDIDLINVGGSACSLRLVLVDHQGRELAAPESIRLDTEQWVHREDALATVAADGVHMAYARLVSDPDQCKIWASATVIDLGTGDAYRIQEVQTGVSPVTGSFPRRRLHSVPVLP